MQHVLGDVSGMFKSYDMLQHFVNDSSSTRFTFISVVGCMNFFSIHKRHHKSLGPCHNCISFVFATQKMQSAQSAYFIPPVLLTSQGS